MKLFNPFKFHKTQKKEETKSFSDFFLHASQEEQKRVLKEAAHRANIEQQKTFAKAQMKVKEG